MKYRTRFLALLLAGMMTLSLTACTGSEDSDDALTSPTDSADSADSSGSVLPDDFVADTSVEDLCLATADIPGDFELFTVNSVPVTARAYLYWLNNSIYISNSSSPEDWKADALNTALLYNLVASKARELGYEMTQEQTDELDSNLALTVMMMGGEETFEDALRKTGLDYDTFYQMNAAPYYYEQLMNGLYDEPTAEEMDTYIEENDILYAKHILLMTVDPLTGESLDETTIAEKRATAENLLAQLQASADLTADFDALMNEYSEDTGLASYPDGYTFTAGEMVEAFETATRALEFGQISDLVESNFGYHIILRLDPDTESARLQYRADLLDAQMVDWFDEADIVFTDEYEALDPQMFYEKFMAYQEAFTAEDAAAAAAESSADSEADASTDPQEN